MPRLSPNCKAAGPVIYAFAQIIIATYGQNNDKRETVIAALIKSKHWC